MAASDAEINAHGIGPMRHRDFDQVTIKLDLYAQQRAERQAERVNGWRHRHET